MSYDDYNKAHAIAEKQFRQRVSKGQHPYLSSLDDLISDQYTVSTMDLGYMEIPIERIAGTRYSGRESLFSNEFYPLADPDSEFAAKWKNLCEAHLSEGIRDAIEVYEYYNLFYVTEGNKRVSVLKYFDAVTIHAHVIRLIPHLKDPSVQPSPEYRHYREFLEFWKDTHVNCLWITSTGGFDQLLSLIPASRPWNDAAKLRFQALFYRFLKVYKNYLSKIKATEKPEAGDALLACIKIYGYEDLLKKSPNDMFECIRQTWMEIHAMTQEDPVSLVMTPPKKTSSNPFSKLFSTLTGAGKKLMVGFIYEKDMYDNPWVNSHEIGRAGLYRAFPSNVTTKAYYDTIPNVNDIEVIEGAIADGCHVLFVTSPLFLQACLTCAIKHPNVAIFNCSMNVPHPNVHGYYGRTYEPKFIVGAIAGALAEDNRIGYIADYPTYGNPASINAFALGAQFVNPRAKVYLEWACGEQDPYKKLLDQGITLISAPDRNRIGTITTPIGLYRWTDNKAKSIALTWWYWDNYYKKIVADLLKNGDSYKTNGEAVNYWWGISADILDVIYSRSLPEGVKRLAFLLRDDISKGHFDPFGGKIFDQAGVSRKPANEALLPTDILRMNWLTNNVIGELPSIDQIRPELHELIKLQGVSL